MAVCITSSSEWKACYEIDWKNGVLQNLLHAIFACQKMQIWNICSDFFHYPYSSEVWKAILSWQGISTSSYKWSEEIQWANRYMKVVYKLTTANTVYWLWMERNKRVFKQKQQPAVALIRHIIQEIHGRGSRYPRIATRLLKLNMYGYPQSS